MRRRLAVILASDVAGYSRLVALDEETTIARFAKLKSLMAEMVTSFHGRIFNTAGDAILAEFASATDAVRCALEFQDSVRARNLAFPASQRLLFRIGIAIGDVLVQEEDGDLLGDGVNIAARLQALADPGGICMSQDVHSYVDRNLSCATVDLGLQNLKNLTRPVHAFSILAADMRTPVTAAPPVVVDTPRRRHAAASRPGGALLAGIALLAVISAAGWWAIGPKRTLTPPPKAPAEPAQADPKTASQTPPAPPIAPVPVDVVPAPAEPQADPPPAASPEQLRQAALAGELGKLNLGVPSTEAGHIASAYLAQEPYKALAVAPGLGTWRIRRAISERDAGQIALEACQLTYGKPCILAARGDAALAETDDERRTPQYMPRVVYSGPFDLAKIPILGPADRIRPALLGYGSLNRPKAMAIHPHGRFSIKTGATVAEAEANALAECDAGGSANVEGPCRTYALDDQVVLPQRRALAR